MRKVYYGKTAAGKTRICEKIIKKYRNEGLDVVSNTVGYDSGVVDDIDTVKQNRVLSSSLYLKDLYTCQLDSNCSYKAVQLLFIRKVMKYMMYRGDVLVLDDIDSMVPESVLKAIIRCLSDYGDMCDLWDHVIMVGYSEFLMQLKKGQSPICFIDEVGNVKEISDLEDIEERYGDMVYE